MIDEYVGDKVQIYMQFIAQYFNLDTYVETEMLDYTGLYPVDNYLLKGENPFRAVYVIQSLEIDVFLQRFFDLSSFSFFNFAESFEVYETSNSPAISSIPS